MLSTWNALLAQVRCVVTYSPRTGRARGGDVGLLGNKIVESYVEQAIFSTPGIGAGEQARLRRLRRAIDREPLRSFEEYKTLPNAAAARALLGVTEVLPPGHQEVSRRSAPTIIMPLEVPMAPLDATSAPLDAATALSAPPPVAQPPEEDTGAYELPTDTLRHTPFDAIQRRMGGQFAEWEGWDWISDFGDPIAEHHAVRETVGIWDESPLQKWLFRGPDALAAADYCFTSDMAGLAVGQVRYGAFCDERGKHARRRHRLQHGRQRARPARRDGAARPTATTSAGRGRAGPATSRSWSAPPRLPHLQLQGPRSRELLAVAHRRRRRRRCATSASSRTCTIGGVPGCLLSRTGYSGELGYEIYSRARARRAAVEALLDPGQSLGIRPYGLAAVESLRIESGLIFIGFDYFPAYTSPFHMNLDRMIKLDKRELPRQGGARRPSTRPASRTAWRRS